MIVKGKIITVWSPIGNNGTTFTSISLAKRLNDVKENVVLVDLNLKFPRIADFLMLKDMPHNLDNLYSYVEGKSLSKDIILSNIEKKDGLDVLKGTLNTQQSEYIDYRTILPVIEFLKDIYSYIVIDCCNLIDNAGTYVALKEADVVLSLLSKDIITTMSFNDLKPLLFANFNDEKFHFIINKDTNKIHMTKEEIEDFLQIRIEGSLPFMGMEIIDDINKGAAIELINRKNLSSYRTSIDKIIQKYIFEDDKELKAKKKSFFSFIK